MRRLCAAASEGGVQKVGSGWMGGSAFYDIVLLAEDVIINN